MSHPQPQVGYAQPQQRQEIHTSAKTAMQLGIASIFCGITGPLALIMGNRAKKEIAAVPGRYSNAGHANTAVITGSIGSVFLVLAILVNIGKDKDDTPTTDNTQQAAAQPGQPGAAPQPAPASAPVTFLKESCLDLAVNFGPQSKLSDLQKEEMWPQYEGKHFKWQLQVTEVSSDTFGGYTVQFKCSPKSPSLIQDIQLKYDDNAKSFVMGMQKGASYEIKGKLGTSSTLLGMTGDGIL